MPSVSISPADLKPGVEILEFAMRPGDGDGGGAAGGGIWRLGLEAEKWLGNPGSSLTQRTTLGLTLHPYSMPHVKMNTALLGLGF